MNYQSNQIIICVEQKCNINREIKDWNNLQEHIKLLHDIMIKEKFQQKVKDQYDQKLKEEQLKYLNQLNDFLQDQENILNQQIKSLFQSIKTLCVEYLQKNIVLPQYNYTMAEQLKIYFHEIQIINPKQPLDFLFSNLKKVMNAAKDNFQNYETQIISIILNDNKMIETPTEQQFEQKQVKKIEPIQQQQYDRNQLSNAKNQQQYNYDKQQEQQKQKDIINFVNNQQPVINEEPPPLRGYKQQVQPQFQNQDRIRFQMPSEVNSQNQQQQKQYQYYVPKETNNIYAPKQQQNQSDSFTKKNNQNAEYVPKQQYYQYQYEQQNVIDESLQKHQQVQQNNQDSLQNQQQKHQQFYQHEKNNQVQVEQKEKQQVQQIEQKVNQDQKIQSIVKVQETRKKFDIVNSEKQLKFKNRFTEFFCSFEQDALVDGLFGINEDAKVGFYFSELKEETPYPIIEMGVMEVDQDGQKIINSQQYLENNEKETIFIIGEEYWMEYESKNRVLKYRYKNNQRQINISKGQYYKFYVRVCGLNVKIL